MNVLEHKRLNFTGGLLCNKALFSGEMDYSNLSIYELTHTSYSFPSQPKTDQFLFDTNKQNNNFKVNPS